MNNNIHPFLRWAGGKRWLVNRIKNSINIHDYTSYHEPFVGGGALLFFLRPSRAYISDSNEILMLTYEQIKDHVNEVIQVIKSFDRGKEAYYQVRNMKEMDRVFQAARFIYLNQLSYNGIYRVNSNGEYNVPYGNRDNYRFDFDNMINVSNYLKKTRIKTCDFEETIKSVRRNALVFLDPPYTHSKTVNRFIQYNQKVFTYDDQNRLSKMIDKIKSRDAYYVLTNADHEIIRDVFDKKDRVIPVSRNSRIGGKSAQRGQYEECIFTNTNLTI